MTALPTTVGETNTQPCVSNLHRASAGFGASADEARSSAWIDASCISRNAKTTTRDRFGMTHSAPFRDCVRAESLTSTRHTGRHLFRHPDVPLRVLVGQMAPAAQITRLT